MAAEPLAVVLGIGDEPLISLHRPPPAEVAALTAAHFTGYGFDPAFPAALIALCSHLSLAEAQELYDELSPGDAGVVLEAALQLIVPAPYDRAVLRLRLDGRLASEMAYCAPKGIPHSVFLGWSQADRDLALAWQQEQSQTCQQCGTHPAQWAADPDAFVADLRRCPGCERLEQARKAVPDGELGVHAVLEPRGADDDEEESS